VQISGSYSAPAHNIAFQGVAFEHTTWLTPSTNDRVRRPAERHVPREAYQQPSNFLSSCQSGCLQFEATRNSWVQVPAAVQVSAASNITFTGDTFTHLGPGGPRDRQRRERHRLRAPASAPPGSP
jgi:cytoskeletal protein RodZ